MEKDQPKSQWDLSAAPDLEKLVNTSVEKQLKLYKVGFWAFAAGFGLFIAIGLLTRGELFQAMLKGFYPPSDIYADVMTEFMKDEVAKKRLINETDYSQISIDTADFETFPQLGKEIPQRVWSVVSSGTEENYGKMIGQPAFFNALVQYHTDVAKSFLLPSQSKLERARKVMEIGKIPLDVQLLMAGKDAEGNNTARCYKKFDNRELQAIMVIPETTSPEEYSWYDCSFGWPSITLKVDSVDGIRLVGVRRNGKAKNLILLLSQEAAKQLQLQNWESYKANAFGKVMITNAE